MGSLALTAPPPRSLPPRSCVRQEGGACPAFQAIFFRDMQRYFDTGDRRDAYGCFREALVDTHPCKALQTAAECRQAFVAAMRAPTG
eukprot:348504-Prymnesium_polylepis.1